MVKRRRVYETHGVPYIHSSGSSSYRSSRSGAKRRKTIILAPDSQPPSQPSFGQKLGRAAAGYVSGGLAAGLATTPLGPEVSGPATLYGAVAGGIYGWNSAQGSSQKNMKSRTVVTNKLVNRSSMKKTGKTKVKQAKTVKVSPYLRKAIKQVAVGESAKGTYIRTFKGLVGASLNIDDTNQDFQILGNVYYFSNTPAVENNFQTMMYTGHNNTHGDHKTIFGGLFEQRFPQTSSTGFAQATFRPDTDLNFFTPGKIWHAASVLFNNKAEAPNPYFAQNANLKTVYGDVDGSQALTSPGMLKINVLNSQVEFTMKNMSLRTLEVDIYECVTTQKLNSLTPLVDAIKVNDQIQDGSDNKMIGYYSNGAVRLAGTTRFIAEGTVDGLSLLKGNGWKWTYEKRTMVLAPQEICVHTVKGPSGVLDFKKLFDTSSQQSTTTAGVPTLSTDLERTACALKGWSKHCMIAVRVDPVVVQKVPGNESNAVTNPGGRYINVTANVDGALTAPLYVECKESYKIAVPEIAGFQLPPLVVSAGSTGGGQKIPLNFRKPRIQITNLTGDNKIFAGSQIVLSREENPVASSAGYSGLT